MCTLTLKMFRLNIVHRTFVVLIAVTVCLRAGGTVFVSTECIYHVVSLYMWYTVNVMWTNFIPYHMVALICDTPPVPVEQIPNHMVASICEALPYPKKQFNSLPYCCLDFLRHYQYHGSKFHSLPFGCLDLKHCKSYGNKLNYLPCDHLDLWNDAD